ncbi:3-dehydroquinate synthase II family protein [Nocardia wallacei]|uniref:3-dehydroquinate synthase II family protein n=1 Tax=Nocardia wallacei TaxID=480035 RepID=UPI0024584EF1|nr:3-dehydroquinate synthase II family protein [Nocardia wallacei]
MKFAWIDVRRRDQQTEAIVEEAIHNGIAGIVADDPALLHTLPPHIQKVVVIGPDTTGIDDLVAAADVVLSDHRLSTPDMPIATGAAQGVYIDVVDEHTLDIACRVATELDWLVVHFRQDPSRIPLEILLAAGDRADCRVVTVVHDLEDAEITLGVLERGSEGVLLAPRRVGDATDLVRICHSQNISLTLEETEILSLRHVGLGERVCIDTCTHFGLDEGILVGSFAKGMLLACSETHPLPYMPTRPFRVNAAALHSYALAPDNHTRYLTELRGGSELLAVNVKGEARRIAVGRIKMETRPLMLITARTASGTDVELVMQNDWHVRVLGPGGSVLNITDLRPGDVVLGHTLTDQRHVGYPIKEFLHEQ